MAQTKTVVAMRINVVAMCISDQQSEAPNPPHWSLCVPVSALNALFVVAMCTPLKIYQGVAAISEQVRKQ